MPPQRDEVLFLDWPRIIRNKPIDADNSVPLGQQPFAEMRPDKASGAGDEAMHGGVRGQGSGVSDSGTGQRSGGRIEKGQEGAKPSLPDP